MKVYFYIILLLIQPALLAQVDSDTLPVITSWQLDNYFSQMKPAEIDTNLENFQVYYPNYKYSISNSYLGNMGTATLSNIVSERVYNDDVFFLNYYLPYFHSAENTQYYNTRKQFSRLTYTFENLRQSRESSFEAFHTQNLTPKFNIGLRYYNISAKGQYRYLKVRENSFRLFSSYTGQKYVFHTSLNLNYSRNNESGGVIDSYFRDSVNVYTVDIPTLISGSGSPQFDSDALNHLKYMDILVSQRLKLFTLASKTDTTETKKARNIAEPILTHTLRLSRISKKYTHDDPALSGLYTEYYYNTQTTNDSIQNFRVLNTLQLEFKSTFRRKFQTGIYGLIGYDYEKYRFISEWDTTYVPGSDTILTPIIEANGDTLKGLNKTDAFTNTFVSAGIYGNFRNRIRAQFSGTLYLAGQKSGQTEIRGNINTDLTILKREYQFDVEGVVENMKPAYLLDTYYSNHYMWEQNLKSQNGFHLSSKLRSPSKKFELCGNYYVLSNFIYFNEYSRPQNYEYILNYFSIEATKTFKLWKIYSLNKIVYQVTENTSVLPLPKLAVYSSTYFDHTFRFKLTDGTLQAILGVDIYYNSSFNGYKYNPALSVFYVQNDELIGNFLLMDLFLNIRLKSVRFFVKSQHFNSSWFEQNYYSMLNYPYNRNSIKFGLSWVFYN